jgi:alkaline phosphatase
MGAVHTATGLGPPARRTRSSLARAAGVRQIRRREVVVSGVAHRNVGLGAILAAGLALGCAGRHEPAGAPRPPPGPPAGAIGSAPAQSRPARNVILFVADGMKVVHEVAASRYLAGRDDGLVFHDAATFDWAGFAATWDVTTYDRHASAAGRRRHAEGALDPALGYDVSRGGSVPYPLAPTPDESYFLAPIGGLPPATDSAAAATALSTGRKTDVGNVAWRAGDPPDGALPTIAEEVRRRHGAAIGVVSTVPFTHATPAAFVSHSTTRAAYAAIGREIIHVAKPEVVVGGGWPGSAGAGAAWLSRSDHAALASGSAGYTFVQRAPGRDGGAALLVAAEAVAAGGGKLFGLFGGAAGNFEPPIPTDDGSAVVRPATDENPTLAQATRAALLVLARDPDGFFLMVEQGDVDWANHAGDFPRMVGCVWDLDRAVREAIAFVDRPGDAIGWENTLLVVTSDHGTGYLRLGPGPPLGKGVLPSVDARGVPTDPSQYTSAPVAGRVHSAHTNELVGVYAKGGGAARLLGSRAGTRYPAPRVVDNTQIWEAMAEFLEVREGRPRARATEGGGGMGAPCPPTEQSGTGHCRAGAPGRG